MRTKIAKSVLAMLCIAVMAIGFFAIAGCGSSDLGIYKNQQHTSNSYINVLSDTKCKVKNFYYNDAIVSYRDEESGELAYTKSGSTVYVQNNNLTSYRGSYNNGVISFGTSTYKK